VLAGENVNGYWSRMGRMNQKATTYEGTVTNARCRACRTSHAIAAVVAAIHRMVADGDPNPRRTSIGG
jgi:hypothetical protein